MLVRRGCVVDRSQTGCRSLAMRWIAHRRRASHLPHAQQQQAGNTTDAHTAPHHHRHPPCDNTSYFSIQRQVPSHGWQKVQPIRTVCTEARPARVPLKRHASLLHHLSSLHVLTIDEPERLRFNLSAMARWPSPFQQLPVSS
jgi:hypothetical protein